MKRDATITIHLPPTIVKDLKFLAGLNSWEKEWITNKLEWATATDKHIMCAISFRIPLNKKKWKVLK